MLTLVRGRVPLASAIVLVQEYIGELEWLVPKIVGELERKEIVRDLEQFNLLATVQSLVYSKKGRVQYRKWRYGKLRRLDEIEDEMTIRDLNVFERLNRMKPKQTPFQNLIDRIKRK